MARRLIAVLILVVGVAALLMLRMTRPEPEPAGQTERSWPVAVMEAQPGEYRPALPVYSQVTAPDSITVTAPLGGRIAERPVAAGDRVAEGDLLVALDPEDIQPQLDQAEAEVADLEAQLDSEKNRVESDRQSLAREQSIRDSTRRQLERTRSLAGDNLSSRRELDSAREALEQAELAVLLRRQSLADHPPRLKSLEARVRRAKAALAMARRDAGRARVEAPFAGVVGQVEVAAGDQVTPGSPLLTVYEARALELRGLIPAGSVDEFEALLDEGRSVEAVSEDGRHRFRLVRFAGESDTTGTEGIFRPVGDAAGLRPGRMIPLVVFLPPEDGVVAVPYSALYGSDSLYLMTDDDRMRRVRVTRVGERLLDNGQYQALVRGEGLSAGDRVITTHLPNAIEGLKVVVAEEAAE